jgi:hypothetical protein
VLHFDRVLGALLAEGPFRISEVWHCTSSLLWFVLVDRRFIKSTRVGEKPSLLNLHPANDNVLQQPLFC